MTSPKAVVFDLGKVLLDFDYSLAIGQMLALCDAPRQEIEGFIRHSPLLVHYEKGQISREEFFAAVQAVSRFRGTLEEFARFFADIFTPIQPMIDFHARLRANDIPTFILSNTNDLAISHIRASYPFFKHFDGYVLSYEHGAMKPESALYEATERLCGLAGNDLLYFDDCTENVQAGARRGWQAVLHLTSQKSLAAAAAAGLSV